MTPSCFEVCSYPTSRHFQALVARRLRVGSVEKVGSLKPLQIGQKCHDIFDLRLLPLQIDLELSPLSQTWMMTSPTSASETRTCGTEKIGSRQYSDFFNRIGQEQTSRLRFLMSVSPLKQTSSRRGIRCQPSNALIPDRLRAITGSVTILVVGIDSFQLTPSGAKSRATSPLSDFVTRRSNTMWPKPVRDGGVTSGPPRSAQLTRSWRGSVP